MAEISIEDLVERHRHELLLHCYRLLGSLTDAEDVLQEVLVAAWRGLDGFEGRSSLRTWLYRIATNRALNAMRDRSRRMPLEPVPPFEAPEPTHRSEVRWLQPYPDALIDLMADTAPGPEARYSTRESVELAFIVALQRLAPRQAAVLVLCDVLGYKRDEAAEMLGITPTAAKGLLQRARASVGQSRGRETDPPPTKSTEERRLARRFVEAFCANDFDTLASLLTDDAWLSMPPASHEYHGREAVIAFLRTSAAWSADRDLEMRPWGANRQPAFVCRFTGPVEEPAGVIVLTLSGGRIRGITRFLDAGIGGQQ